MNPQAVMVLAFAVVLLVALAVLLLPGAKRRTSARWIRDKRVPVTPDLVAEIESSRWRQRIGGTVGALVGLAAILPILAGFDVENRMNPTVMPVLGVLLVSLIFAGEGVSGLVVAIREIRRPVRVAHSRAAQLTDYVVPSGLLFMRAQQVVAITGIVIACFWSAEGDSGTARLLYAGCVIAGLATMWLVSEGVARRLVAQPLLSPDPMTLFWRTALRGERLRRICGLPAALGIFTTQLVTNLAEDWSSVGSGPILVYLVIGMGLTIGAQILLLDEPRGPVYVDARQAAIHSYEHA
jgi:hypothetical protein